MTRFQMEARTRIVRGPGRLGELGSLVGQLGAARTLLVADPALPLAARMARTQVEGAGSECLEFAQGKENPDSALAETVRQTAEALRPDLIVARGGGSTLDLAKAAGFLLANGGQMSDYQGYGLAKHPLPALIAIPTTTGTGSEAQSYCVIADAATKRKMACGAPTAAAKVALLDPELALSQPRAVRAASGYDAIAHAVETWVTTKRNEMSDLCAREAWRLLSSHYLPVLERQEDVLGIGAMQWGAYLAGWAIEHSMLGAAHACANPLTRRYGTTHAHALAVVLPAVVSFNSEVCRARYDELSPDLEARVREFGAAAGLPSRLRDLGAAPEHLEELAEDAAAQWTGRHNPRPFDAISALEIYRCVY
jgi:alcohol dehydrogenase